MTNSDTQSEEAFLRAFKVKLSSNIANGNMKDPRLSPTFNDAINLPDWSRVLKKSTDLKHPYLSEK